MDEEEMHPLDEAVMWYAKGMEAGRKEIIEIVKVANLFAASHRMFEGFKTLAKVIGGDVVKMPCPICRYLDNDDYPSCRKSRGKTGAELCKYCAITGTKNLFKRRRSLRDILPWSWR